MKTKNASVLVSVVVLSALSPACMPEEEPIPQEISDSDLIPAEGAASARQMLTSPELMTDDGGIGEASYALTSTGRYDRGRARYYLRRYATEPNPKFAYCANWNGSVKADCTNFASQVLWYGGLPLQWTSDPGSGWWYDGSCRSPGSSATWRQVNALLYHLTVVSRYGEFVSDASQLQVGDVIFYKLRRSEDGYACDGSFVFNHTAVVSGFEGGTPLVAYHSNDAIDVPWNDRGHSRGSLGNACQALFVRIRY
jgi:hypothetical protein